MKLKLIFQSILILTIITILAIFYYSFLKNKHIEDTSSQENNQIMQKEKIANELINIEYNSTDEDGNTFYINAEKAIIDFNDQNKAELEGVVSVINLKSKGIINIYSKNAYYNKLNHNTLFYNDVKITYLNNSILSQNFDVIFTEKKSKIHNNVIFENNKLVLKTDKILIDMISGDIKLEMVNKKNKVKLFTKNELIN